MFAGLGILKYGRETVHSTSVIYSGYILFFISLGITLLSTADILSFIPVFIISTLKINAYDSYSNNNKYKLYLNYKFAF